MPSEFINVAEVALTGNTTVYTAPASTQSVVIGFQIANRHTDTIYVDVSAAGAHLVDDTPIPIGSALVPIEGKLVLEAGDSINIIPSVDGVSDASLSILELT